MAATSKAVKSKTAKTKSTTKRKVAKRQQPSAAKKTWLQSAAELGLLRIVLFGFALVSMLLAPKPGTVPVASGWEMVSTLLAPVLAPLILMVLLLDVLMSRLFMVDKTGAERARLRKVLWIELVGSLVLFLYWLPYFLAMRQ